jgi:hypothetical protein
VENGTLGTVAETEGDDRLTIKTHGATQREVDVNTGKFNDLRLSYAQHVYKAQGRTVDRAFVLTGGWQTDREHAYVALTRARERTDLYVSREDLGEQGMDTGAIERLGEAMAESHAQQASVTTPAKDPTNRGDEIAVDQSQQFAETGPVPTTGGLHAPSTEPDPRQEAHERESEAGQIMRESDRERDHALGLGWEMP